MVHGLALNPEPGRGRGWGCLVACKQIPGLAVGGEFDVSGFDPEYQCHTAQLPASGLAPGVVPVCSHALET